MAEQRNVMKELYYLLRKADRLFDGQVEIQLDEGQLAEGERNEDKFPEQIMKFYMTVTPNTGLYKNVRCMFRVFVDKQYYPSQPPTVQCLSKIFHPNIDLYDHDYSNWEYSNICVNLLEHDWQPDVGLDGCVMAVLYLFHHPNLDDALSTVCSDFVDWADYESQLYKTLRGGLIDGILFDKLLQENDDNESNANGNKIPVNVANNDVDDTIQDYGQSAYILPNGQHENKFVSGADVLLVKEGDPCNGSTNFSDSQLFTNVSPPLNDPCLSSVPCTDQGDSDHMDNTLSPPLSDPRLSSVPSSDQGNSDHTDNTLSSPLIDLSQFSVLCADQDDNANAKRIKPAAAKDGWFTKLKEGFTRTFWTIHKQKS